MVAAAPMQAAAPESPPESHGLPSSEDARKARHALILAEIGRRIRTCRRAEGISMRELGERIGVSSHQIHKYESGEDRMSASTLYKVSQTLGMEVSVLLQGMDRGAGEGEADWAGTAPAPADPQAQERAALVDAFARITDRALRRLLLNTVRRIADGEVGEA